MNKCMERIRNGIITENPTFVQILGMCPTLAVTTSAVNGLGMGLSTTVILIMSNLMISALRNIIPNRVRIPAYIVIVASFVTIIDFLLQAFLPGLSESLGGYIKLIVVNCIILGRAESYASKNPVVPSVFDGVGMGLGFTVGLTAIGLVRELLGAGSLFGITIPGYQPIGIFVLSPGAFIVLAFLIALLNYRKQKKKRTDTNDTICRGEDCMHCGNTSCGGKFFDFDGDTDVIGHVGQKLTAGEKAGVQEKQSIRADQTEAEPSKRKEAPKKKPAEQTKIEEKQKEEKIEPSRQEEASENEMTEQTETVEQSEKVSAEAASVKNPTEKIKSSGKGKKNRSKKKASSSKEKAEGITEAVGTVEQSTKKQTKDDTEADEVKAESADITSAKENKSSGKKADRQEVEADE